MAESAVTKHFKERAEKAKNHKTKHDVERLHHLMAALTFMRDYPQSAPIAADLGKEVQALSIKQAEEDAKAGQEDQKELAEARAADAKGSAEEADETPHRSSASSRSR
jgi:hypothetical protein